MRRLLLSQAQVSVAVSSGVVLAFTILLFLSGYVLQQRTVKDLKLAIQPRIPKAPPSLSVANPKPRFRPSRVFRGSRSQVAYADFDADVHSGAGANVDWSRLAHIQLVRNHHDVCSAIMVLAELHWQKSPARRLLLFPKSWAEENRSKRGEVADPYLSSTRRLMKLAARRYQVELYPIDPFWKSASGEEEKFSLASAFALPDYFDRVLTIETPGLLLDAEPLDVILGFTDTQGSPLAILHNTSDEEGVHSDDLFLLQPRQEIYANLTSHLSSPEIAATYEDTHLQSFFPDPLLLSTTSSDGVGTLMRSIGTLHDADRNFNQTAYLSDVSYIRFSDPKLPGPEYEVPWSMKFAARPRNKDADWTWTKLYGEFAQKRMDVCGLELESWRP